MCGNPLNTMELIKTSCILELAKIFLNDAIWDINLIKIGSISWFQKNLGRFHNCNDWWNDQNRLWSRQLNVNCRLNGNKRMSTNYKILANKQMISIVINIKYILNWTFFSIKMISLTDVIFCKGKMVWKMHGAGS